MMNIGSAVFMYNFLCNIALFYAIKDKNLFYFDKQGIFKINKLKIEPTQKINSVQF
jgi:hypothetical protein